MVNYKLVIIAICALSFTLFKEQLKIIFDYLVHDSEKDLIKFVYSRYFLYLLIIIITVFLISFAIELNKENQCLIFMKNIKSLIELEFDTKDKVIKDKFNIEEDHDGIYFISFPFNSREKQSENLNEIRKNDDGKEINNTNKEAFNKDAYILKLKLKNEKSSSIKFVNDRLNVSFEIGFKKEFPTNKTFLLVKTDEIKKHESMIVKFEGRYNVNQYLDLNNYEEIEKIYYKFNKESLNQNKSVYSKEIENILFTEFYKKNFSNFRVYSNKKDFDYVLIKILEVLIDVEKLLKTESNKKVNVFFDFNCFNYVYHIQSRNNLERVYMIFDLNVSYSLINKISSVCYNVCRHFTKLV